MAVDSALKNSKGDMKKLKTSFAIQRAKDKAEHAQSALMKEKQLKEMVGSGVFIVNFEHISHLDLVFLL